VGSVIVLVRMFVLIFPSVGRKTCVLYRSGAGVRNGDSDLDSPAVHRPRGRLIGPGRVSRRGDEVSCKRVGCFPYRTLVRAPSAGDVASPPFGGGVIAQVWRSVRHQQATWHPLLFGGGVIAQISRRLQSSPHLRRYVS